jgi:diguanylate cyclase (GGDEF)-like protein/PAS domain S-box-containing protein
VLAVAFLAETVVMYLLPHLLADPHGFAAILTDSSILATLSAPPLWWLLAARARAEKALRKSEQQFRSLIENALDIIMGIGPDGALRYVSPSVQRTLGYKPEELVGKNPSDLVHPDDLPTVMAAVAENLRSTEPGPLIEIRLRHRDGSWRAVEAIGRSFLDESGALGIVVNARDITQRKRAEEALRETEAKYHTLVEQIPAITYIDVVDEASPAGFTPVYFSPQIETMLGYPSQEFMACPDRWADMIHPDDRERALAEDALHYATGEPSSHEYRLIARDGRVIWVHDQAVMVLDQSGDRKYSHGVLIDITQRKQAEEALREAEERWRSLVENAPDLIITVDREGAILFMNHAVPGFTVEDAIGTTVYGYVRPEYHETMRTALERLFETGEPQGYEVAGDGPSGRTSWYASRVGPIMRDGEVVAATIITSDITERRQAEEELARVNSALKSEHKQIDALNRSLERKVKERTRDLRIANRELQQRHRQLLDARAQASTDVLTGLPNHRAFHERARDEVGRAQVNGTEIGMIMMDIDGFKSVNDSQGHLAGDRILRGLARTLARAVPQDDAYRYGGDEFAVLLPGASCGETTALAEQLRRSVEKRRNGNGEGITISLGVACYPDTASSAEELIYGSDAAMYWAKSAGKNCVGDWSNLVRHRAEGVLPWYAADRAIRAPDTVSALVAALAAKDPATSAHTERCSWYAARLAEELGLGERDTSIVRLSSLLHDIGKLAVPDDTL